jgi:hypothetical protein
LVELILEFFENKIRLEILHLNNLIKSNHHNFLNAGWFSLNYVSPTPVNEGKTNGNQYFKLSENS